MNYIEIKGAREHNLKNINVRIPRGTITCIVGVSGSGKSTLAFDIIAKEGQRQYLESLSTYARRFLSKSNRPDIDEITGISPSVVVKQQRITGNPRSTVGTITETYSYLRLLYARCGFPIMDSSFFSFNNPKGACPECKGIGKKVSFAVDKIINRDKSLADGALLSGDYKVNGRQWTIIKNSGLFDMNKKINDYTATELSTLLYSERKSFQERSDGFVQNWSFSGVITRMENLSRNNARIKSDRNKNYLSIAQCNQCQGQRLSERALSVKICDTSIAEASSMEVTELLAFVHGVKQKNAYTIKPRLVEQLQYLIDVGLGYISLDRSSETLSGGEAQRVKFARQLGSDLTETVYIFDEPTAGLHQKDKPKIMKSLRSLQQKGNTVIIVEHDPAIIKLADLIVEVGPGGGKRGGEVVFTGKVNNMLTCEQSLTRKYLRNNIVAKEVCKKGDPYHCGALTVSHAKKNNLKNITVDIPLNQLVVITGVSGSGKSSLVEEFIEQHRVPPLESLSANKAGGVVYKNEGTLLTFISQKPIGKSSRSIIATYVGIFDEVRKLFAQENKVHPSLFSFNGKGACRTCKGVGYEKIDMNFLGDIEVDCEECSGDRYKKSVLQHSIGRQGSDGASFQYISIANLLHLTASEALLWFQDNNIIAPKLQLLIDVGLDYIELGQALNTLSGGESQRLKLASKIISPADNAKRELHEVIILDEPTAGLHPADVEKLLLLFRKLIANGYSLIVVEHNQQVIGEADHIIELGPEGGEKGGYIVRNERV